MSKSRRKNAKQIRRNAKAHHEAAPTAGLSRLRWDDLEVLLALGRSCTLSGAAQRLRLNTSTVARRLDAMEASLGVHLFDRTPTGIAATELAEGLFPIAEAMERAAADALRLVEGRETEPEGTVRLTAPPGLANWFIAPGLVELRQRFPKLMIELEASVGYADLTRREADLALRGARPRSGDLLAVRLTETEFVMAASPALVERSGPIDSFDAFDWMTWGPDLAHLPDAVWIASHVSPGRVVLRTSSMDAQLHAARAGLGAVLLPLPFIALSGLAPVRIGRGLSRQMPPLPRGTLWLVGHRALRHVPRVQAVWDFIVQKAAAWT